MAQRSNVRGAMARCRDLIEGNAGIISRVGSVRVAAQQDRGAATAVSDEVADLDNLTKVFAKGISYTSIVEDPSNRALYLSFMGNPPAYGVSPEEVRETYARLERVAKEPTDQHKRDLLSQLCRRNGNPIVRRLRDDFQREIDDQIRQLPNDHRRQEETARLLQMKESYTEFARVKFDQFLAPQELGRIRDQFLGRHLEVVRHDNHNPEHRGVHVEMKATQYARMRNPAAERFNVGLAASSGESPGSCFGCSAEFRAIESGSRIAFARTADFRSNFPPQNYTASANVTREPELYLRFGRIVQNETRGLVSAAESQSLNQALEYLEQEIARERGQARAAGQPRDDRDRGGDRDDRDRKRGKDREDDGDKERYERKSASASRTLHGQGRGGSSKGAKFVKKTHATSPAAAMVKRFSQQQDAAASYQRGNTASRGQKPTEKSI